MMHDEEISSLKASVITAAAFVAVSAITLSFVFQAMGG